MYYFKKETTILKLFDETTKMSYDKIGRKKPVFWIVIYLLSLLLQIVPVFLVMFSIGVIWGIFLLATGNIGNAGTMQMQGSVWMEWASLAIQTGLVIVSFFLYIKFVEKRPILSIGLGSNNKLKKYLKGALIAIIMQLSYFAIVILSGWGEILSVPKYATNAFGTAAIGYTLLFLVAFIIQGASEEVVVRGWMLPVLSKHYKVSTSIIISSLFFGLLHLNNPNITALSVVNLILFGIFAALYTIHDDSLWGIFAIHSIWNWVMGNVLGLPVSGMILGKSSIIETNLIGPTWLTGGSFGPEGGLIVTLILALSSVIVIRLLIKKGKLVSSNSSVNYYDASK
jgi:membrane protease YdiL (CAAX protease family)